METTPNGYCANHTSRLAVADCAYCNRPFCSECKPHTRDARDFCSKNCMEQDWLKQHDPEIEAAHESAMLEGFHTPVTTGFRLWLRSLKGLSKYILPLTFIMALLLNLSGFSFLHDTRFISSDLDATSSIIKSIWFGYAIVIISIYLSQNHVGQEHGNLYFTALKILPVWGLTIILTLGICIIGLLLFIIPGVHLSLRLFWADEFVINRRYHPIKALRASWRLTAESGNLFGIQLRMSLANLLVIIPGAFLIFGLKSFFARVFELAPIVAGTLFDTLGLFIILICYSFTHAVEIVYMHGLQTGEGAEDENEPEPVL